MPVKPTYPGVFIEELPQGERTITGVATSVTGFIGRALRGPVNEPSLIHSFIEFERIFGGLWSESPMSYSLQHFFMNGGRDAVIVRINNNANTANFRLAPESRARKWLFEARNPGSWGSNLRLRVDYNTENPDDSDLFNLFISEIVANSDPIQIKYSEVLKNISVNANAPRYIEKVLEQSSILIKINKPIPKVRPTIIGTPIELNGKRAADNHWQGPSMMGHDGIELTFNQYEGFEIEKTGIYAFRNTDLLNILVIPPMARDKEIQPSTWDKALKLCKDKRAMLIVDPPFTWTKPSDVTSKDAITNVLVRDENAAIYFPFVKIADTLKENRLETFVPSGAVAGIWARTDSERGVWKAPAGKEAILQRVKELTYTLTNRENELLNPLGVNCLRTFPSTGNVIWGARTMKGIDQLSSEWKYISVRRLALYIEESLYRGTRWAVFEPNDEHLWAQIRLSVDTFMQDLFRQGALQGASPKETYFVRCGKETTTQSDLNKGILSIIVGFAPLKPAEFVIIKIQQIAGQIKS